MSFCAVYIFVYIFVYKTVYISKIQRINDGTFVLQIRVLVVL